MNSHVTMTFPSFHFTTLTYPSHPHHNLFPFALPSVLFASLHFTSLHFTSLHFTALQFALLHFTSLDSLMIFPTISFRYIYHFRNHFQKLLRVEETVPKANARSWFEKWIVLFTKEYISICLFCFLLLIFPS
jgi:hypothetical protein